jgi:hypothetical protein
MLLFSVRLRDIEDTVLLNICHHTEFRRQCSMVLVLLPSKLIMMNACVDTFNYRKSESMEVRYIVWSFTEIGHL